MKGEIVNVRPGPVVTLYELEPAPGVKSSRVIGLADDIGVGQSVNVTFTFEQAGSVTLGRG